MTPLEVREQAAHRDSTRHRPVALEHTELLRAGDTRQILAGNAMYHATYHLERPTVSVVVRTL